ncbi:glycerol acyltransferase [Halioglobus japonicus]|uniref:1-acyl-sn-glycerol-3-phosphate acyltransferase n=1 Tax=Halioglobus japonicus TaxID=930805 RepID=A0AAP8MB31_9GAMM|nr:1-acyl-sn-glycerol-3-phosphate acyltransferase [Halioglobus japonicus]AQA17982.1 glycerol acyltransferase [Halioglobus japonicus]PLW84536.1 1-acyl-sn-glycerol-3-phosphate acyltransferase [Halioglobus japonicus]
MSDPFAEIRPYQDDEVADVLAGLLKEPELLDLLGERAGGFAASLPAILRRPLVRMALKKQLKGVADIHDMQMVIKTHVEQMIAETTGGFTVSGLENLDPSRAYLFISNHRDIAMDPAFTNYALHQGGHQTVRIAIGDNLLTKPWVSDLMRLNKSFIVKRNLGGPRELLAASRNLANYIRHSIRADGNPVWLAQREGRAKDGHDRTEPAVIKMLSMSRDKANQSFGEHIAGLGIVPVAISYELDPCDALKANELHQLSEHGSYEKGEQEDVASIGQGIAGQKGRVHVSFGTPLGSQFEDADHVAQEIDRQVFDLYCLHPTNRYAYEMLYGEFAPAIPEDFYSEDGDCTRAEFEARINAMPEAHRPFALAIYANVVMNKLDLVEQQQAEPIQYPC